MDDINTRILQQGFGVRLVSSYRTRTGLVCRTDRGLLELKKTFSDDESLEMEYSLKEYLLERGFDGIDKAYRTTEDMPCYRLEDSAYILVKYTQSRRMDLEDREDIKRTSETLARFHNAAEGFASEKMRFACSSAEELFGRRTGEFSRIRKRIKGGYTPVDLMVIKYFDYYMDRIKRAMEMLKEADYGGAARKAAESRCVCHNAFKNDNIRMDENGEMVVSGLDGCTYGVCASDVAQLIRRYIKSDLADEAGVADIIESYTAVRPMDKSEREIIRGLLVYPYKFLKLCNEHYNKRRVCISEAAVERFESCADCGDREMKFAMSI